MIGPRETLLSTSSILLIANSSESSNVEAAGWTIAVTIAELIVMLSTSVVGVDRVEDKSCTSTFWETDSSLVSRKEQDDIKKPANRGEKNLIIGLISSTVSHREADFFRSVIVKITLHDYEPGALKFFDITVLISQKVSKT